MSANSKLVALAAAFSMFVAPAVGAANEWDARYDHPHYAQWQGYRGVQVRNSIQYSDGWRYRFGRGWDNTCINVSWLPSQFACSPK